MADVWRAGKCIGPNVWVGPHEICDSQGSGGNGIMIPWARRITVWIGSDLFWSGLVPRRPIRLSYLFRDGPGYLNYSIAQLLQLSISRVSFFLGSRFIK